MEYEVYFFPKQQISPSVSVRLPELISKMAIPPHSLAPLVKHLELFLE